jgi:hypothetical protein
VGILSEMYSENLVLELEKKERNQRKVESRDGKRKVRILVVVIDVYLDV